MSKFGLMDPEESHDSSNEIARMDEKLAAFPPVSPRQRIDIAAVDAAAAEHGFVSREPGPPPVAPIPQAWPSHPSRRRRVASTEPTRHLAIRLTLSQYDRFVAYADRHQVTYHDALSRLMDEAEAD